MGDTWWDSRWPFRLRLQVGAAGYDRENRPAEVELDLLRLLPGVRSAATLRVVEVDDQEIVLDEAVPFQFDVQPDAGGKGTLVFLLKGFTAGDAVRRFHVYLGGPPADCAATPTLVTVVDGVEDEGQACFQVVTPSATYYYQKEGAGFSSLLDRDGNDWISYRPEGGSAGHYRGIPNLGECGHPGYTNSVSRLASQGPLRARILSQTNDGRWAFAWDIYSHYARMTLLRAGGKYWFLYEGTPGGRFDEGSDYCVRSTGQRTPASEIWDSDIPAPEWVYFGSGRMKRIIYLVHHEDDDLPDQYWPMEGNMTVFGFGRRHGSLERFMQQAPAHFTIGFAEDGALPAARRAIGSAFRDLEVTVGTVEARAGGAMVEGLDG